MCHFHSYLLKESHSNPKDIGMPIGPQLGHAEPIINMENDTHCIDYTNKQLKTISANTKL
jgi:hypothetical protein